MDPPSLPRRTVDLGDGRRLVVRPVGPDDVDGLLALYEELTLEDRHRRFFSAFMPARRFFEDLVRVADRGGAGLVAVLTGRGEERVVAEASFVLLPDGDGELAITVAAGWRGWLGPYLLDALLAAAAARGVPNLQADVLVTNAPMLALLRSRGYATLDHPDGTVVRMVIGTQGATPRWPGPHDRPRVLVEAPGGRWHAEDAARAAGLQVVVCPGPTRPAGCPAVDGRPCALAAEADVVVVSHPLEGAPWRSLPAVHRAVHAGVPVCVEPTTTGGDGAWRDDDLPLVPRGSDAEVVRFVRDLATGAADEQPDAAALGTMDPSLDGA